MLYFLSVLFIVNTSFYFSVKLMLICGLLLQGQFYYRLGKPHPELHEIRQRGNEWVISSQGGEEAFCKIIVLIHNPLFQLLQASQLNKNKLLILFNDQLSKQQLRLLHLKSAKT
ncbi:hypothetical protein ELY15_02995 [Legionella sp. km772]|nr:hypothetical protein ELY15_02995 [Legionella sp. km772]